MCVLRPLDNTSRTHICVLRPLKVKQGILHPATSQVDKQFYVSDEVNRIVPGTNDCSSVISQDKEIQNQKQV
jgi:hypothetical protein